MPNPPRPSALQLQLHLLHYLPMLLLFSEHSMSSSYPESLFFKFLLSSNTSHMLFTWLPEDLTYFLTRPLPSIDLWWCLGPLLGIISLAATYPFKGKDHRPIYTIEAPSSCLYQVQRSTDVIWERTMSKGVLQQRTPRIKQKNNLGKYSKHPT